MSLLKVKSNWHVSENEVTEEKIFRDRRLLLKSLDRKITGLAGGHKFAFPL